jgi:hypothetical protein
MMLMPLGLLGCAQTVPEAVDLVPSYYGVAVAVLGPDLFQIDVTMRNAAEKTDVAAYAECAAARLALTQGYGFARHVRSTIVQDGDTWRGDAIYTLSATLPPGIKTLDAEVISADCIEKGIPAV